MRPRSWQNVRAATLRLLVHGQIAKNVVSRPPNDWRWMLLNTQSQHYHHCHHHQNTQYHVKHCSNRMAKNAHLLRLLATAVLEYCVQKLSK